VLQLVVWYNKLVGKVVKEEVLARSKLVLQRIAQCKKLAERLTQNLLHRSHVGEEAGFLYLCL
jgi:hypothetical protein